VFYIAYLNVYYINIVLFCVFEALCPSALGISSEKRYFGSNDEKLS
jgi:hypothetical protein